MQGKINIPSNLEDAQVLKQFLTNLATNLNSNPFVLSKNPASTVNNLVEASNTNKAYTKTVAEIQALQQDIKIYVEKNLETVILQSSEDIATIAEQFGTFYDQALAAAWYGLSVKAGGVISGFTVGSIDTDTTTPGTESSFFAINADSFTVARAIEDVTDPAELAYLQANNLPYGTLYDAQDKPIPAFVIDWNGFGYDIFFNGKVQFSNLASVPDYALQSYVTSQLAELQNQIDGNISTWFNNGEPTLSNIPAVAWTDDSLKSVHVGDIYYDKATGYGYRFAYEDIEDTPDAGVIYSWIKITDTDVVKALSDAANAQATADGKITTFYQASAPVAEGIGDIWVNTSDFNKLNIWNGSTWTYTRDTSKDQDLIDALGAAENAQATADNKIESYYQNTAPLTASEGDLWFDTDNGNKIHTYRSGTWINSQDSAIGIAIDAASDAQATADGKITTFYQASAPVAEGIGDIWINSTTDIFSRWDGSVWVVQSPAKSINNGTTTIDGGKITATSLSVISANLGEVNAGVIYNSGGTSANYNMKIDLNNGEIHIK